MLNFDQPSNEFNSIIKVVGVGGGGSNAVNHMFRLGISGVDFIVCNTDIQALQVSPVPHKVQLGATLTEGLGAGSVPEVGRNAAIESINEIREMLSQNTKMVFITAGMGGGTGTGAAPVIAQVAKELGILTVGIITIPFAFEGKKRRTQADSGLEELKNTVDTLLIISNEKLREIHGNLKLTEAFAKADDVLTTAAKSIAEIIDMTLHINVDFNDIRTVMHESGVAIMGSSAASGEGRAIKAVEQALSSPLLNDNNITGARYVLLNVTSGKEELSMDELGEITDYIQEAAGQTAEIIQGYGVDPNLTEDVKVTIIATGFQSKNAGGIAASRPEVKKIMLVDDAPAVQQVVEAVVTPQAETPVVKVEEVEHKLYEEPYLKAEGPVVSSIETVKIDLEILNNNEVEEDKSYLEEFTLRVEDEIKETRSVEETPVINEYVAPVVDEFIAPIESIEPVANVEEDQALNFTFRVEEEKTIINEVPSTPVINDRTEEIKQVVAESAAPAVESTENSTSDEYFKRTQERISRLKALSFKLKTPNGLSEMENEPAYVRRGVSLNDTPHSSASEVSRYTLTENEEKKIEIKPNNSFLHDNVD